MSATLKKVMDWMEAWAPLYLAEDWDRSGLAVGDPSQEIKKVLDEWDPVGVRDFSPDEYLPLADEIADSIAPGYKLKSIYSIVKRAFQIYGVDFKKSNDECWLIAEKIQRIIQH